MRIVVGRIGRPHGVRGDVSIDVRTDDPDERFAVGRRLYLAEDGGSELTVERSRWHSGRLLLAFAGVGDRGAAEELRGLLLYRDAGDRIDEPGAWYDHDLIGCAVRTDAGPVGTVVDVLHLPAQDVLSVELRDGTVRLVPLVAELVPRVDIGAREVVVADRPGLLFDEVDE